MSAKTGQEKRDGLRLDLKQDTADIGLGGFALNTPDLDKACEIALPTPVLNKKILDMYSGKAESTVPSSQPVVTESAPETRVVSNADANANPPAVVVTTATAPSNKFQSSNYVHNHPILIVVPPGTSRIPSAQTISHPRIGQQTNTQNVVVAPTLPMQPLDPREQERLKVDRKRERNRAAAQRCREKKIARIDELSKEVEELERKRSDFISSLASLEQAAAQTLQAVEDHKGAGCDIDGSEVIRLIEAANALRQDITEHLANLSSSRTNSRAMNYAPGSNSTSEHA